MSIYINEPLVQKLPAFYNFMGGLSGIIRSYQALGKLTAEPRHWRGAKIAVQADDDAVVIPVRVLEDDQYSYTVEEGIVTDCNHLFTEDEGEPYLFCLTPGCGAIVDKEVDDYDHSDEWREQEEYRA